MADIGFRLVQLGQAEGEHPGAVAGGDGVGVHLGYVEGALDAAEAALPAALAAGVAGLPCPGLAPLGGARGKRTCKAAVGDWVEGGLRGRAPVDALPQAIPRDVA